jgi:hypothetical protein
MTDSPAIIPATALDRALPPRLEVRPRSSGTLVGGSIAAVIAVVAFTAPFVAFNPGERPWFIWFASFWIAAFASLFSGFYLHHSRSAAGPHGWVLREDGSLFINLRSHLNTNFDPETASVVVLRPDQVKALRTVREKGIRTHVADGVVHENPIRREYLDIFFCGDAEAVAKALTEERARRGKGVTGTSRHNHTSVLLRPDGALRIAFRDETNRLRPGLRAVCEALAGRYPIAEELHTEQARLRHMDEAAAESRLIEMLERGERVQAIKLAQKLYKLNTTDAVHFVDELGG